MAIGSLRRKDVDMILGKKKRTIKKKEKIKNEKKKRRKGTEEKIETTKRDTHTHIYIYRPDDYRSNENHI